MKVTVLGCGSSGGVPLIGNDWGTCDPTNPYNRRTRVSVLVEEGDQTILVDTSPDMREQLLRHNVRRLSAVIYTHSHADHCHGVDDLRAMNWLMKAPIEVYADAHTMKDLERRFGYIFGAAQPETFYKPVVNSHVITEKFNLGGVTLAPFEQGHGTGKTLGLRFGDFAYSTDVKHLDDAAFAALAGVKVWVVDCVREKEHPTHSHLAQTLEWIERVKPERAFLTHMNQDMDYDTLVAKLPRGVMPAHDGLVIEC